MVDVSKETSDLIKKTEEQHPDLFNRCICKQQCPKDNLCLCLASNIFCGDYCLCKDCWNNEGNEAEVLLLRKPLSDADMTRSEAPESVLDSGDFDFKDKGLQAVLEFGTEEVPNPTPTTRSPKRKLDARVAPRIVYTCLYPLCPHKKTKNGFVDRASREEHQRSCTFRNVPS